MALPPRDVGTQVIDEPLPCTRCGYNLVTIPLRGTCPECGGSIAETLLPFGEHTNAATIRSLRSAASALAWVPAMVVLGVLLIALLMIVGGGASGEAGLLFLMFLLAAFGCVLVVYVVAGCTFAVMARRLRRGFVRPFRLALCMAFLVVAVALDVFVFEVSLDGLVVLSVPTVAAAWLMIEALRLVNERAPKSLVRYTLACCVWCCGLVAAAVSVLLHKLTGRSALSDWVPHNVDLNLVIYVLLPATILIILVLMAWIAQWLTRILPGPEYLDKRNMPATFVERA